MDASSSFGVSNAQFTKEFPFLNFFPDKVLNIFEIGRFHRCAMWLFLRYSYYLRILLWTSLNQKFAKSSAWGIPSISNDDFVWDNNRAIIDAFKNIAANEIKHFSNIREVTPSLDAAFASCFSEIFWSKFKIWKLEGHSTWWLKPLIGGFAIGSKTKIRYHIICCYYNFTLW